MYDSQTLAVPVTPPGRGAVALIHVSGPQAPAVVERLLETGALPSPGRTRHAWLVDAAGERLDDALLVREAAATSLTGHPLVEVGVHGGPAVLEAVMRALVAAGARRGEWKHLLDQARRAGALDPIRLAAYRRLARTVSRRATGVLARALSGDLQAAVRAALIGDDRDALAALAEASRIASTWLHPLRVVLVGPPNAGKSTLFNALLGWERATVSTEAGTTRDAVEEDLLVDDRPIRLVDTAGGPAVSPPGGRQRPAHVVVHVVDATKPGPVPGPSGPVARRRVVRVMNKVDRLEAGAASRLQAGWIPVSARQGTGLDPLMRAVFAAAGQPDPSETARWADAPALFTRRDRRLLETVLAGGPGAAGAGAALLGRTAPSPGEGRSCGRGAAPRKR